MAELFETSINVAGTFPTAAAKDVTISGDGTGTPFEKNWMNNHWGSFQKVLEYGGLTPDGSLETGASSQFLEALKLGFAYPGEIVPLHVFADPATLSPAPRLLLLEGQGILRSSYADLDASVYVGDSNNPTYPFYYHADDAAGVTRNVSGIYLILPDLRGYVLRGLDVAAAVDPGGATRVLADIQADIYGQHNHGYGDDFVFNQDDSNLAYASDLGYDLVAIAGDYGGSDFIVSTAASPSSDIIVAAGTTGNSGSSETRMVNTSCRFAIRY